MGVLFLRVSSSASSSGIKVDEVEDAAQTFGQS
jgi:hypothetical protein